MKLFGILQLSPASRKEHLGEKKAQDNASQKSQQQLTPFSTGIWPISQRKRQNDKTFVST